MIEIKEDLLNYLREECLAAAKKMKNNSVDDSYRKRLAWNYYFIIKYELKQRKTEEAIEILEKIIDLKSPLEDKNFEKRLKYRLLEIINSIPSQGVYESKLVEIIFQVVNKFNRTSLTFSSKEFLKYLCENNYYHLKVTQIVNWYTLNRIINDYDSESITENSLICEIILRYSEELTLLTIDHPWGITKDKLIAMQNLILELSKLIVKYPKFSMFVYCRSWLKFKLDIPISAYKDCNKIIHKTNDYWYWRIISFLNNNINNDDDDSYMYNIFIKCRILSIRNNEKERNKMEGEIRYQLNQVYCPKFSWNSQIIKDFIETQSNQASKAIIPLELNLRKIILHRIHK